MTGRSAYSQGPNLPQVYQDSSFTVPNSSAPRTIRLISKDARTPAFEMKLPPAILKPGERSEPVVSIGGLIEGVSDPAFGMQGPGRLPGTLSEAFPCRRGLVVSWSPTSMSMLTSGSTTCGRVSRRWFR